jgi:hypothetical protein
MLLALGELKLDTIDRQTGAVEKFVGVLVGVKVGVKVKVKLGV